MRGEFTQIDRYREVIEDFCTAEATAVAQTVIRLGWGAEEGKLQNH